MIDIVFSGNGIRTGIGTRIYQHGVEIKDVMQIEMVVAADEVLSAKVTLPIDKIEGLRDLQCEKQAVDVSKYVNLSNGLTKHIKTENGK